MLLYLLISYNFLSHAFFFFLIPLSPCYIVYIYIYIHEWSILEFKSFFFATLLEWCLVLPSFSCISLSGLLKHCTLIS